MAVYKNAFEKLKNEKILIDLYRDEVADDALTGILIDYNESFCCLSLIDEDGTNNGISVIQAEDISRIRWEGNDRESLILLMQKKKTKIFKPSIPLDSLKTIIESIQTHFGHVNIQTEYMDDAICFIGEVEDIDDDFLLLKEFGTMASRDRSRLLVSMKQISRIDADSQYEKDIVFLNDHYR